MIRLEKFSATDFELLISWIHSEEELIQFAGPIFSYPLTNSQLIEYLNDEKRKSFKVINENDDFVIGHAEIYRDNNYTAKLCRILIGDEKYRGKGLGRELILLLVNKVLQDISISNIELNVYEWNTPAIKCYKNCGFEINSEKSKTIMVKDKEWKSINMTYNRAKYSVQQTP